MFITFKADSLADVVDKLNDIEELCYSTSDFNLLYDATNEEYNVIIHCSIDEADVEELEDLLEDTPDTPDTPDNPDNPDVPDNPSEEADGE